VHIGNAASETIPNLELGKKDRHSHPYQEQYNVNPPDSERIGNVGSSRRLCQNECRIDLLLSDNDSAGLVFLWPKKAKNVFNNSHSKIQQIRGMAKGLAPIPISLLLNEIQ
jgi:hypothetical protein